MLCADSKILMCTGRYKHVSSLRIGDTFLNHKGGTHTILWLESCIAPTITLTTDNWYRPTNFVTSNELLDSSGLWTKPSMVDKMATLNIQNISNSMANTPVTDKEDLGLLIGTFLTVGGFSDDDVYTPFLRGDTDARNRSYMKIFKAVFPKLACEKRKKKVYLDPSIKAFLYEIVTSPESFVMRNRSNLYLIRGIKDGITRSVKTCMSSNINPQLLETVYLINQILDVNTYGMIKTINHQVCSQPCILLDVLSDDNEVSFVANNMIMRHKTA